MRIVLSIFILFSSIILSYSQAGATFCGPYTKSEPISLSGVNNQTLSELDINNPEGNCIELSDCQNITIQRCKLGPSIGNGVDLYNCTNILIFDCRMDSVATGVYALECEDISVENIQVTNVQGPMPRGQMVQFNQVSGTTSKVNYNVVENPIGTSGQEDAINMYKSNGTVLNPIQIIGNWIRGGGPSNSGGGILIGDAGGSNYLVKDNVLVNPGQYGIGVASGTNIQILHNTIFAKQQDYTNVGIYVWNQYDTECNTITVQGNKVNWTNSSGNSNGAWDGTNCGEIIGMWSDNDWSADINDTILPTKIIIECSTLFLRETSNCSIPIYPNPSTGRLYFASQYINASYTIYSLLGTIVKHGKITAQEINLSDLTHGMYMLKIERKKSKKIEVIHLIKN